MARGYNMDVSFQANQSYTKKNRRRIDVPLSVPGAEMRLPSLPMLRASARWLSLALIVIFSGFLYFLWNAPFFQVSSAEILGLKRVRGSDVNAFLQVSGKPVFMLHPGNLQKMLEDAFPEFSSVTVDVSLPSSVTVKVTERTPVLTWRLSNQSQLVDADGYVFPMRMDASQPISPVVEAFGNPPPLGLTAESIAAMVAEDAGSQGEPGDSNQDNAGTTTVDKSLPVKPFLTPEMVAAILAISKATPANVILLYDPNHGLGWQDERGWKVYLGDDQQMAVKLNVYEAIVQRLLDEEIQPALISVEHVHNPYYRLEQ